MGFSQYISLYGVSFESQTTKNRTNTRWHQRIKTFRVYFATNKNYQNPQYYWETEKVKENYTLIAPPHGHILVLNPSKLYQFPLMSKIHLKEIQLVVMSINMRCCISLL